MGWAVEVKICLPPTDGTDIADWLAEGKAYAAKVISGHLQSYEPPAQNRNPYCPKNRWSTQDDIRDNSHYRYWGWKT